jgi:NADH:ubiquinone oxidoreductase subunit E
MDGMQSTSWEWQQVRRTAEEAVGPEIAKLIDEARRKEHPAGQLISVLHAIQAKFGFLSDEHMAAVAQLLQVPAATVTGVATFYHFFKFEKPGRFVISLCMGTACYVKGADKVAERLRQELGIDFGETTRDGLFSFEQARCLGMCGLAPVLMINDRVYEKVSPDDVPALLQACTRQAHEGQAAGAE